MNHEFLIKTRRACINLDKVTEAITRELGKLRFKLAKEAEAIILHDRVTGKAYLSSNLKELLIEEPHVETKVKARLRELEQEGFDDYATIYANTKEVAHVVADAISELLQLLRIYYPEETGSFQVYMRRYLPFDITLKNLGDNSLTERYFDDERSNEQIFLSKIIANPASQTKFTNVDELVTSMVNQAAYEFDKYKDLIEAEIEAFPTATNQVFSRELQKAMNDYKSIVHGNLIIDSVLRDSDKFGKAFKLLANTIDHLEGDELTNICRLTIKRLVLLRKIDFLNFSMSRDILPTPPAVLTNQEIETRDFAAGQVISKVQDTKESVENILQPLSGSWNRNEKIKSEIFLGVIEDVHFLIREQRMPDVVQEVNYTGFPNEFVRKTFAILYNKFFPKRSKQSRELMIRYIHSAYKQFANVSESTTNKKFTTYLSNYEIDKGRITYSVTKI
ncbi:hypothetical protein [Dyadobacter sp. CY323]|uniref:hypothetical protein n=1 Tax=Dyadobacter sp. CY323 TaxID=2907302 RepID=UPI001F30189E|nr:hypothetical protein [Dyadobacter sp. CY323]MCE6988155.1 hypothetical protein [Dyadobacter sp. CY323]